jgi:hypothetical protein
MARAIAISLSKRAQIKDTKMPQLKKPKTITDHLEPRARSLFETFQMTNVYEVKAGKVQLMLYHRELGIIGNPRLSQLDFELRHRSDGSLFWWKQGHNHLGGFITAVREITERHRLLAA